jgi:hypothetical protein
MKLVECKKDTRKYSYNEINVLRLKLLNISVLLFTAVLPHADHFYVV